MYRSVLLPRHDRQLPSHLYKPSMTLAGPYIVESLKSVLKDLGSSESKPSQMGTTIRHPYFASS